MQIRDFDLVDYLRQHAPTARPSGARGEWVLPCLVCGGREHLYVSTEKRCAHCFRCGWSPGLIELLARAEKRPEGEIRERLRARTPAAALQGLEQLRARVLATGARRLHRSSRPPATPYPDGYIPLGARHDSDTERALAPFRGYLAQRRVPADVIARHAIGCALLGRYAGRVILPVLEEGRLVTFQARDITGRTRAKYLGPTGAPLGEVLFNLDEARTHAQIILCEGIISAICTGPDAVASFGKTLKPVQVALLVRAGRPVIVLYDAAKPEPQALDATREAIEAARHLRRAGVEVSLGSLPWGDPADHPREDVRRIVDGAPPFTSAQLSLPLKSRANGAQPFH